MVTRDVVGRVALGAAVIALLLCLCWGPLPDWYVETIR